MDVEILDASVVEFLVGSVSGSPVVVGKVDDSAVEVDRVDWAEEFRSLLTSVILVLGVVVEEILESGLAPLTLREDVPFWPVVMVMLSGLALPKSTTVTRLTALPGGIAMVSAARSRELAFERKLLARSSDSA